MSGLRWWRKGFDLSGTQVVAFLLKVWSSMSLLSDADEKASNCLLAGGEDGSGGVDAGAMEEEELLRRAIALSLEQT